MFVHIQNVHKEYTMEKLQEILPQKFLCIIGTAHFVFKNRLSSLLIAIMAATVFIVNCVGSNWLNSGCGVTKPVKSQQAVVGTFDEFCFNVLILFAALQLHSRSHLGSDLVETSDLKS